MPRLPWLTGLLPLLSTTIAHADDSTRGPSAGRSGVTAIWILANVSFAGMRAQNHPSAGWRAAAFIFGFPGTLLTYFIVEEGGGSAYGIHLPPRRPPPPPPPDPPQ